MLALHRGSIGAGLAGLLVVGALTVPATAAWAAPPPNDDRGDAVLLQVPATVQGTLAEATQETTNDFSGCAETDGSVWYHFTAPERGAVVAQLDAAGQMDATVDLFLQVR